MLRGKLAERFEFRLRLACRSGPSAKQGKEDKSIDIRVMRGRPIQSGGRFLVRYVRAHSI